MIDAPRKAGVPVAISDFIPKFVDPYDRQARLYPGLLVFAPLAVLLVCLYGADHILASSILAILGFCGASYALGRVARNAGKRVQDDLFEKWGGPPTTQVLRHCNAHFDAHTKERFHGVLAKGIGKKFPSVDIEKNDPKAADELYRAGVIWLITKTSDHKAFPLVFKENIAFGFQRNALGLRPLGVIVASACLFWALVHAKVIGPSSPYVSVDNMANMAPPVLASIVVSFVMLGAWLVLFNEAALRRAGFAYAERLMQSCDRMKTTAPRAKKINTPEKAT
jgi:hypothetical protein